MNRKDIRLGMEVHTSRDVDVHNNKRSWTIPKGTQGRIIAIGSERAQINFSSLGLVAWIYFYNLY